MTVPSLLHWHRIPHHTKGQKRRWLPFTLLLVIHLIIAALISLALAQPQLENLPTAGGQHTVVIIDSSVSMSAPGTMTDSRLAHARDIAKDYIQDMSGRDTVSLIAAESSPRLLTTGDIGNRTTLLAALKALQPDGIGMDVAEAITLAQSVLTSNRTNSSPSASATSGQAGAMAEHIVFLTDLEQPADVAPLGEQLEWRQVGAEVENRAVVVCTARPRSGTPNAVSDLYLRLGNYSGSSLTTHLRLFGDDEQLDDRLVTFSPDGDVELTWELPVGVQEVRVELDGQDDYPEDDTAIVTIGKRRFINTLVVTDEPEPLVHALSVLPNMHVRAINPAHYASSPMVAQADIVVFNGTLTPTDTLPKGSVFIINPAKTPGTAWYPVASTQPVPIDADIAKRPSPPSPLVEGIHMGGTEFGPVAVLSQQPTWATTILEAEVEAIAIPVMLYGDTGESRVVAWNFDLAQTNLPSKLAFPMLLARAVEALAPPSLPRALMVGETVSFSAHTNAEHIEVQSPTGETHQVAVDEGGRVTLDLFQQPGIYTIEEWGQGAGQGEGMLSQQQIAVNIGSPLESNLRPHPAPVLGEIAIAPPPPAAEETAEETQTHQRDPIWSWVILVALIALVGEWAYSNL
jgi:hypothetical protein